MGGGVVDFLKATRGARTKLGENCPFYSVVWRRGGGHLTPKTPDQVFTGRPFDARADREHDGSTDVIDEILMRGNWPEEGGVR